MYEILAGWNYNVRWVQAAGGQDFSKLVMKYLHEIKKDRGVLVAVCTQTYGEDTGAYSTYTELHFAHANRVQILPLMMEDEKPQPNGTDAQDLVELALPATLVHIKCRSKSDEEIAEKIAAVLTPSTPQ